MSSFSRSWSRRAAMKWTLGAGAGWALAGCVKSVGEPFRFGFHPWPGYVLVGLADDLGAVPRSLLKVLRTPSASASLRGLSNRILDGAGLTLDEVLLAREQGTALTIVAIVDQSLGADVVLARQGVHSIQALRGARIGAEQTAVGAVMVDACLTAAGLTSSDVTLIDVSIDEHEQAVNDGRIDAVVTYEPVKTRLLQRGWRAIFSSAEIPGRIVDVLAVRSEVLEPQADAVRALVKAFFAGREAWVNKSRSEATRLAEWLSISPSEVEMAFSGLDLPGVSENRVWLQGDARRIEGVARSVAQVLQAAGLLKREPDWSGLASGRFVG